jgi:hypothetical protein
MLYSEIIAVCSQIHIIHINTLCGQNVEILAPSQNFENWLLALSRLSVRPSAWNNSAPTERDFHKI